MNSWKNKFSAKSPLKQSAGIIKDPPRKSLNMSKEDFIKKARQGSGSGVSTQALKNQTDFLNHKFYKQNAKNAWGEDAEVNTQKQIDRMKAAHIKKGNSAEMGIAMGEFVPPSGDVIINTTEQNPENQDVRIPMRRSSKLQTTEHELGHVQDASKAVHKFDFNDSWRDERPPANIYQLHPEFSGYEDLKLSNSHFTPPGHYEGEFASDDYLKNPSEFRTRLGHTKKLMTLDNFNWNEKSGDEINNYVQDKLKDESLGDEAKRELQQFSEYNIQTSKPTYTNYNPDYEKYANLNRKDRKKYHAFELTTDKKWHNAKGKKTMTQGEWARNYFSRENNETKSLLEDKDGDGIPDLQMRSDWHFEKQQDPKFIEHVFKDLAQEKPSGGSLLNRSRRNNIT